MFSKSLLDSFRSSRLSNVFVRLPSILLFVFVSSLVFPLIFSIPMDVVLVCFVFLCMCSFGFGWFWFVICDQNEKKTRKINHPMRNTDKLIRVYIISRMHIRTPHTHTHTHTHTKSVFSSLFSHHHHSITTLSPTPRFHRQTTHLDVLLLMPQLWEDAWQLF